MKKKLKDIKPNPNNPRFIKDKNFKKLVNSIKEFPQMLNLRRLVVDEDMVLLGGNMRYKAMLELGIKEAEVTVATGLTDEQKKEFIIKDNVGYGDWDWDALANEWDLMSLDHWGLDITAMAGMETEEQEQDQNATKKLIFNYPQDKYDKVIDALIKLGNNKETALYNLLVKV